ncbi:hypothetical protein D0T50_08380 [Bacteroides sp. 214]|uniref:outer membrane protein n=1 Tax=Bacteroides sp. 214 TaxID=2302935 RepID=UPI0013D2E21C|nr:porin family protein [Bacteroides sp. 214]NDW12908.1 hypothetical protein [Bacteroides sp. 214]
MRRYYFLSLFFLLAVCLHAQEKTTTHEFFVSYGFAPVTSIPEPDLPINSDVNSKYTTSNEKISGTINIGYLFHLSDPFAIGVTYSYSTIKRDVVLGSSPVLAEIENKCHTIMLTGKYEWLHLKKFSFYSRVGIGFMLLKKGDMTLADLPYPDRYLPSATMENDRCVAWQVMPLGVEWNFTKSLALFAEGGVGSAGCGMAGVKVKF